MSAPALKYSADKRRKAGLPEWLPVPACVSFLFYFDPMVNSSALTYNRSAICWAIFFAASALLGCVTMLTMTSPLRISSSLPPGAR
jgi:hypothetical protein